MSAQQQPDEWLDVETARQRAGLKSGERIRQLCKANQLIYKRESYHCIKVTAASLDAWIARRNKAAAPPAEVAQLDVTTFGSPDRDMAPGLPDLGRDHIETMWIDADALQLADVPTPYTLPEVLPDEVVIARAPMDTILYNAADRAGAQGFKTRPNPLGDRVDVWFADGRHLIYDLASLINLDADTIAYRLINDHVAATLPPPERIEAVRIVPDTKHQPDDPNHVYDWPGPPTPRYNKIEYRTPAPLPSTLGGQHKRTGPAPAQDWRKVPGTCACAGCDHRPLSRHYAGGSLHPGTRYHGRLRCPVCRATGCDVDHVRCHITIPDKGGDTSG